MAKVEIPAFSLLGVRVHALEIDSVIAVIRDWIRDRTGSRYIAVTGMHGVMEAQGNLALQRILADAALVVPDGMPLVWMARRRGLTQKRRVYGPELLDTFCRETGPAYRHYFFGGGPGVAEDLAKSLRERYGIEVAGWATPPFRPLTVEELDAAAAAIDAERTDILWVGLSTPKQEALMAALAPRLRTPVQVGIGAAYDFLTGRTVSAPTWMKERGLEWCFRLCVEPRRLWRRYLLKGSRFVVLVAVEEWRRRRFEERQ